MNTTLTGTRRTKSWTLSAHRFAANSALRALRA